MICRSTIFEMICAKNAAGACVEIMQNNVYNGDGSIAAVFYVDPVAPLVPLDTTGYTIIGAAPCKGTRDLYRVCVAGVQVPVFRLTDCAGATSWVDAAGAAYTPVGTELPGAVVAEPVLLEKGYDVINIGTATQTCVEVEIIKTVKCDGTLGLQFADVTGAPYVLVGVLKWECPCVKASLGVITDLSLLG